MSTTAAIRALQGLPKQYAQWRLAQGKTTGRILSIVPLLALCLALCACDVSNDPYAKNEDSQGYDSSDEYGESGDGANDSYYAANGATERPAQAQQASGYGSGGPGMAQAQPQGWSAQAPQGVSSDPRQPMQTVQVIDRELGMPMGDVQIPMGWQMVGGVTWIAQPVCASNQIQENWAAVAPDGITAIGALPGFAWQVGSQNPYDLCPAGPFRSAREFLEIAARQLRPNAQAIGWTDRTRETEEARRKSSEQGFACNPQLPKQPYTPGVRTDAGELRIAYSENGVRIQEVLGAAVSFMQGGASTVGTVSAVTFYRAPEGRLNMDLSRRVFDSTCPNPQWLQASQPRMENNLQRILAAQNNFRDQQIATINTQGATIAMRESQKRHAMRMDAIHAVGAANSAIYRNTDVTDGRIQRRTLETIGEYNTYNGVNGPVQSSIHNDPRLFQNQNDPNRFITTGNPYFSPPSGYTELERQE